MPVEIKELFIKVTVNEPNPQAQQSSGGSGDGGQKPDKDGVIAQCIEQVLDIINNKKER